MDKEDGVAERTNEDLPGETRGKRTGFGERDE